MASITYFTPRNRDGQQAKAKENSFDTIMKEKMKKVRALELEENQTFQLFC